MKTKTGIFGSVILLLLLICGCKKDTDSSACGQLNGNAKLKRILEYSPDDSIVPLRILEQYAYDEKGRISRVSIPKSIYPELDSSVYLYEIYQYNSGNQLTGKVCCNANIYAPTGYINTKNHVYTYSDAGLLIQDYTEYPLIGSFSYVLYFYSGDKLAELQTFTMDTDELESRIGYTYDDCGRLIKENSVFMPETTFLYYTVHQYKDRLRYRSDVYAGRSASEIEHIRIITKTYDAGNNLIADKIDELQQYSTQPSRVIRYEYYDE